MRILIVGAGGHAQVVADSVLRMRDAGSDLKLVGFVDEDPAQQGRSIFDMPVVAALSDLAHDASVVAIGDNTAREKTFSTLRDSGERFVSVVHPSAVLAPDVTLGAGVVICAGVVINTGATIGDNSIINTGATIDHHCNIGAHAHIAPGCHLAGNVEVGEGTLVGIGSNVIPGITIGSWLLVRAGSTVVRGQPS